MKFVYEYSGLARLFFGIFGFFLVIEIHCADLDNFIHIDYIKKQYPEVDIKLLKAQAILDEQTAPVTYHIDAKATLRYASIMVIGPFFTVGMMKFLLQNSDKITLWLHAISPKYPLEIFTGTSNRGDVIFGVLYYYLIPYTGLIYWIAKH